jgi:hypothetical protein
MADISKPDVSEKEASSDIEHLETMHEQHKHVDTALDILGDERVHVSEEDVRLFLCKFYHYSCQSPCVYRASGSSVRLIGPF